MKIEHLTKKIDGQLVLDDISVDLTPGEIIGLIGRNGSGKTTMFRTLAGHYLADGGEVLLEGEDLLNTPHLQERLFYLDEQYHFLNHYSLIKIGRFYQTIYQEFDFDFFLNLLQKQQLPLRKNYRSLSKGMQGLFNIILALASNAPYLFLDEPFDGLDVIVKKNVIRLLLENMGAAHRTVLISSHNLNALESLIDRALLLKDNQIVQDYRLETIRQQSRKLQLVFQKKQVPELVKANSKVINIQGRVVTAVFENYTPELEAQIKQLEPIVFEELPLSLEDLFEANLSREADYQLFM
ncbi:ATP-binding cassette domain-containing protein [Enterococcus sp. LJL120]